VDKVLAPSATTLHAALLDVWRRLAGGVTFVEAPIESVPLHGERSWSSPTHAAR